MFCFLEDLYEEAGRETIIFAFLKDSGKKKGRILQGFLELLQGMLLFPVSFLP